MRLHWKSLNTSRLCIIDRADESTNGSTPKPRSFKHCSKIAPSVGCTHEGNRGQTPISAFVFVEKIENSRVTPAFRPCAWSRPGLGVRLDRVRAVFQKEPRHIDAPEATGPAERRALFSLITD